QVGGSGRDVAQEPVIGEEAGDQRAVPAAERLDVSVDAVGGHDHVGKAVAVDVSGRDVDGAFKVGEGEEAEQLRPGDAVEHLDVARRGVGGNEGVGHAVKVHVAHRDTHAALVAWEGRERQAHRAGGRVDDADVGVGPRTRADHDRAVGYDRQAGDLHAGAED